MKTSSNEKEVKLHLSFGHAMGLSSLFILAPPTQGETFPGDFPWGFYHSGHYGEGAGGIFDFNATLPLVGLDFVCLSALLIYVFFRPVQKDIACREKDAKRDYRRSLALVALKEDLFKEHLGLRAFAKAGAGHAIEGEMQSVRARLGEQNERQLEERKEEVNYITFIFGWEKNRFSKRWLHGSLIRRALVMRAHMIKHISQSPPKPPRCMATDAEMLNSQRTRTCK
jgi:hypothetical protein